LTRAYRQASLSGDERLIYQQITNAGNEGIWTKTLKLRTNLHQQVVSRCLKTLEQKNLIKSVKSNPTRKLYMLIELTPSAEVTGGPWFTDQELDVDFIETLTTQCYKYIYSRASKLDVAPPADAIYSASYTGYPTAREISKFIADRQISNIALSMEDIQCLLDVLVLDGKVEKRTSGMDFGDMEDGDDAGMSGSAGRDDCVYRAVRDRSSKSNPWTETPCGKCPVFSFCTDDGPISPDNCVYFTRWLQF
ncbi:RNA polymerase Rpc34, partial [Thamnocephalis sphaerospora]